MTERNSIHHADAFELMRQLPEGSIDAVITDPPYGIGLDKWDSSIDIPAFMTECRRVLKPNAFIAFTGQMPTLLDWMVAARAARLTYREHIAWVKRKQTTSMLPLNRAWENVLIYAQGTPSFRQTKGRYEDVKLAGLLVGTYSLDGLERYTKDLRAKLNGTHKLIRETGTKRHGSHAHMYAQGGDRSPEMVNFTNVWSFLPENMATFGSGVNHASVKPVLLFERMIELLTDTCAVVLDPFAGSGTTAVAARQTGRDYIVGDSSAEYVAVMRERLAKPYTLPMLELEAAND